MLLVNPFTRQVLNTGSWFSECPRDEDGRCKSKYSTAGPGVPNKLKAYSGYDPQDVAMAEYETLLAGERRGLGHKQPINLLDDEGAERNLSDEEYEGFLKEEDLRSKGIEDFRKTAKSKILFELKLRELDRIRRQGSRLPTLLKRKKPQRPKPPY